MSKQLMKCKQNVLPGVYKVKKEDRLEMRTY